MRLLLYRLIYNNPESILLVDDRISKLQVSRHYIATIADDRGIIIDRHSGLTVANLPHSGVVKCLVNPHNSHSAITVGDDGNIKFLTSITKQRKQN